MPGNGDPALSTDTALLKFVADQRGMGVPAVSTDAAVAVPECVMHQRGNWIS